MLFSRKYCNYQNKSVIDVSSLILLFVLPSVNIFMRVSTNTFPVINPNTTATRSL